MKISELAEKLPKTELERLYLDRCLAESEIAQMYGTYQVKVGRLRRVYGIPTLKKADRYKLPDLTYRQRMLLIGSMLGDGRLFPSGSETAAYSEFHSEAQLPYLEWKASIWGPFVQSIRPQSKTEGGKTYYGNILRLKASKSFRTTWRAFYPTGRGYKTFVNLPLDQFDGLVLAIWYLDDGSRTSGGHVRFAVSPKEEDQDFLLRLLAHFQIKGERYCSNGSHAILVSNRSNLTKLLDLVSPHVPKCMSHKLDLLPRSLGLAPRDRLSEATFLVKSGLSVVEISNILDVSVTSVRRDLKKEGLKVYKGNPRLTAEEANAQIQSLPSGAPTGSIVDVLLRTSFPTTGEVCDRFFPYRYNAKYGQLPSARLAWYTPSWLGKAVDILRKMKQPVTVLNTLRVIGRLVRTPTNLAFESVLEEFCPQGGLVLDPCAGYGARAISVLTSGRGCIGVEPHLKAGKAFKRMLSELGFEAQIHNSPFEDVDLDGIKVDFAFTSPPLFSVERYADDPTQSWVRYKTWDLWVSGFLEPLVKKTFLALKPSSYFCLHAPTIRTGGKTFPLAEEVTRVARDVGFTHEGTLATPSGRFGRDEPVLVLKRTS